MFTPIKLEIESVWIWGKNRRFLQVYIITFFSLTTVPLLLDLFKCAQRDFFFGETHQEEPSLIPKLFCRFN